MSNLLLGKYEMIIRESASGDFKEMVSLYINLMNAAASLDGGSITLESFAWM